ncbi:MAG: hypothetical protein ACOC33_04035 [bacterium]
MRLKIRQILMLYCVKRAYKYEEIRKMLLAEENTPIYALGLIIITKEKWMKRIAKLCRE